MHFKYIVAILAVQHSAGSALDPNEKEIINPAMRRLEPFSTYPANQRVDDSQGASRNRQDNDTGTWEQRVIELQFRPAKLAHLENVNDRISEVRKIMKSISDSSRIRLREGESESIVKPILSFSPDKAHNQHLITFFEEQIAQILKEFFPGLAKFEDMASFERYTYQYGVYLKLSEFMPNKQILFELVDKHEIGKEYECVRRFALLDQRNEEAWVKATVAANRGSGKKRMADPTEAFKKVEPFKNEANLDTIVRSLRFVKLVKNEQDSLLAEVIHVLRKIRFNFAHLEEFLTHFPDLEDLGPKLKRVLEKENAKAKAMEDLSKLKQVFPFLTAKLLREFNCFLVC